LEGKKCERPSSEVTRVRSTEKEESKKSFLREYASVIVWTRENPVDGKNRTIFGRKKAPLPRRKGKAIS